MWALAARCGMPARMMLEKLFHWRSSLSGLALTILSATPCDAESQASATIALPAAVGAAQPLRLQQIIPGAEASIIRIEATGLARRLAGDARPPAHAEPARLTVRARAGTALLLALPARLELQASGGDRLVAEPQSPVSPLVVDHEGSLSVCLGAVLHVAPHQAAGQYVASLPVTADYQ